MKRMPMKTGDGDSSGIPSNVPAFLVKLWKLVEDPQYEEHISWNKVSKLFCFHFHGLQKKFYTCKLRCYTLFLYYKQNFIAFFVIYCFNKGMMRPIDFDYSCRMEPDSSSTIKLRLHEKSFPSISSTTTLQASFVS